MAIAVDVSFTTVVNGSQSKDMGSGSNRVIFLYVDGYPSSSITAPTIAGNNMTITPDGVSAKNGWYGAMYYYINPPSGSQTVVVSGSSIVGTYVVLSGVYQTDLIEASGKLESSGPSATLSKSITVSASGCWIVCGCNFSPGSFSSVGGSLSAEAHANGLTFAHSNGTVTPGTVTATINTTSSSSIGGMNVVAVRPDTYSPASTFIPRINIY